LAEFHLHPEWRGKGLFSGLEGFSHVWLLSFFHQNKNTRRAGKVHPPRLLGEAVGTLASRSPHRPNPVGLTLARLESVDGDRLLLSGVDLVDQTPILDIKPYLPEADRPETFTSGWAGRLAPVHIECRFSPEALTDVESLLRQGRIADRERFMSLVDEVLRLDPRPLAYRQRVNERFAIVLGGMDVHARFHENVFTVIAVIPFSST
jgi:tRNA-Thr(GGU) m(6)t(6)A37 methyltransferase TsaA